MEQSEKMGGIPQTCCGSAFTHSRTYFRACPGLSMSRSFKVFVAASPLCYAVPAKRSGIRRVSSCVHQFESPASVTDQRTWHLATARDRDGSTGSFIANEKDVTSLCLLPSQRLA